MVRQALDSVRLLNLYGLHSNPDARRQREREEISCNEISSKAKRIRFAHPTPSANWEMSLLARPRSLSAHLAEGLASLF